MTTARKSPRAAARTLVAAVVASSALTACGERAVESRAATSDTAGRTAEYAWYMEGSTPGGKSTVVYSGDGMTRTDSFIHWNNREYRVASETRVDADGTIVSQRIRGTSPFGAPIDESFTFANGVAQWQTPGERGRVETSAPALYVTAEFGAVEAVEALARAAIASMDNTVAVLPAGSARVEKLRDTVVATPDGSQTVSLYAIYGIGFKPWFTWFDESMRLVARDFDGWIGMIPAGWDSAILAHLSELQSQSASDLLREKSLQLTHALPDPLLLEYVDVVDVETGSLLERRHVLLADGKIAAVSELPVTNVDARKFDASGRTLVPGLWDMHGHFGVDDGMLNIAGGVTSVRDIGGVHDKVMMMTGLHDSGDVIGPTTYRAGFIDAASPFAAGGVVSTLEEALERVDFFARNGYLQIKLYSSIDPQWVQPIAERTHGHGMRLSGHIPAFMSADQAVRAGYDEIQHINMVFLNFLAGDREDTRKQLRFTLYGDEAGNLDLDSTEVEDFIALLRDRDVVVDPTAAIFDTQLVHHIGAPDPTFAAVIEHLPPAVARPLYNPEMAMGDDKTDAWARSAIAQSRMLKKLYDGGVQLVPGSDHYAAFTLHRELELYAAAGIPNAAVLRMATLDSATVAGVASRTGSIEVGKDADLVLLDGNPLDDISAVRRATVVIKGRSWYRPDELYRAVSVRPFLESDSLH